MLRVGLTGGIGSGKSTVSAMLAELGALVIDSDLLAREVVEPGTPGLEAVVRRFGASVLADSGALDRPALGALVFADAAGRTDLEQIIHPLVRRRAAEIEATAAPDRVVVHDIPLLVESGQADAFDVVVVVDVPTQLQLQRLVAERGMSEQEASARIAAQASRERRTGAADHVVDNTGSIGDLQDKVAALWDLLTAQPRQSGTG